MLYDNETITKIVLFLCLGVIDMSCQGNKKLCAAMGQIGSV